jgi:hypothetical protein
MIPFFSPILMYARCTRIIVQHLDGSPGKQLTDFKSEFVRDFDHCFDGKQLALIRGDRESDVVIRDSEK